MAGAESRILREAFGHVVCSGREKTLLAARAPAARVEVVENGVDTRFFDSVRKDGVSPRFRLVFVGSMSYHANIEAAAAFARGVWRQVHEQFPAWKLTLVGSNPTAAVLALGEIPGVEVTGTVGDVRPYYREAAAAVVPLRTGGGTRLKILEAMAAGVPVISTTLGAEGLEVTPGKHLLIADSDQEWRSALASIQADPALGLTLSAEGFNLVRTRYDWEILGQSLLQTYCAWLDRQP